MELTDTIIDVTDATDVRKVFGEPIERDGVTVIPVAKVGGGAGGGGGSDETGNAGRGGGYGIGARPMGVYVIKHGEVTFQPIVDLQKIILGGQALALVALLTIRGILKRRAKRKT